MFHSVYLNSTVEHCLRVTWNTTLYILYIYFARGLDFQSICDLPGGQRCGVGSRDPLNINIYITKK